jgi:RNA polymerase sigma-70 factor, ECF subfamily
MDHAPKILANEAELTGRLKTDDAAFATLYNHYFPRIYSYVIRRTGDRETTEDIVSGVFIKAFARRRSYEQRGFSFGAWLYRIAANALVDHYRRRSRRLENSGENLENEPALDDSADGAHRATDRAAIEKVLNKMPPRYRRAISLRYFAEMDIDEISAALGISSAHTSVVLHRALECFRKQANGEGIKFYFFIF